MADNVDIRDDLDLLDLMLNDSKSQPSLYHPGPYWMNKAKNASIEIKKHGIKDFRGSKSPIGLSYADNLFLDLRDSLNHDVKGKIIRFLTNLRPIKNIFESQVRWTESYAKRSILYSEEILNMKPRVKQLLAKYKLPYSLLGNCLEKAKLDDKEYSIHYLNLLEQHDNIASRINFNIAASVFEIGGGFGVNTHLLLENYKNIKKILYLEIPPILYVGTQYLKAIYGDAVCDYRRLREKDKITFSGNEELEIICIAPWQITKFEGKIDILLNAHSFIEMPINVIKNYIYHFNQFHRSEDAAIGLSTYDKVDLNRIMDPRLLPTFFPDRKFDYFEVETLLNSSRKNLYFVSL